MRNRIILLLLFFTHYAHTQTLLSGLSAKFKDKKGLYSIIIQKKDTIIYQAFFNGKTDNDLFNIQSETKSIIAVLVGIAIDKGFIKHVDQRISEFFPQVLHDTDTSKRTITIRHILNHTSGLWTVQFPFDNWLNNPDPTSFLLSQPLNFEPGTSYQYSNSAAHLLSGILTKATRMSTAQFAETYLFKPLGITRYEWRKLADGFYEGGGLGLSMRTTDVLKIGKLLLDKGQVNHKQLVSSAWIQQLFDSKNKRKAPWGLKNSLHGFGWYNALYQNHQVHYAWGYGGQLLLIIPDLDSIIAVNHNHDAEDGIEQAYAFLQELPLLFDTIERAR